MVGRPWLASSPSMKPTPLSSLAMPWNSKSPPRVRRINSFPRSTFSSKVRVSVLQVANVRVQRQKLFDQPVLGAGGDVVLLHCQNQVLDQGIELGVGNGHVGMQLPHLPPGIGAGPATELAQLICQVVVELGDIHALELLVDTIVVDNQVEQILHDVGDAFTFTKLLIKGIIGFVVETLAATENQCYS